jgi:hypothetical protein
MKDRGGHDACRDGDYATPSLVRENPQGKDQQDSEYRDFDKDPGHGPPFQTRLTARDCRRASDYTNAQGINRRGRPVAAIGNADMIEGALWQYAPGHTRIVHRLGAAFCTATQRLSPVVSQFEFSGTNSSCLSAKSTGVTRPYA